MNSTYQNNYKIQIRPNAASGLWLMFLLPLSILISIVKYSKFISLIYTYSGMLSIGFICTSINIIQKRRDNNNINIQLLLCSLFISIIHYIIFNSGFAISFISGFLSTFGYNSIYIYLFQLFPNSFTLGEGAIVSQAFILICYSTGINIFNSISKVPQSNGLIATIFIQFALLGVGLISIITNLLKINSAKKFFLWTIIIVIFFILLPLHIILKRSSIIWLLDQIFKNFLMLKIITFWLICILLSILILSKQIKYAKKASTATRKIFHLLLVAVYLPGLLYCCNFLYLASGLVLGLFFFIEIIRIANITPFSTYLQNCYVVFVDEKDSGILALTPIYLLIGASLPLWIHPISCDITDSGFFNLSLLISGLLTVGIGDTFASIIGSKIGRIHWRDSNKTVEGSIACLLSQVLVILLLNYLGIYFFIYMPLNCLLLIIKFLEFLNLKLVDIIKIKSAILISTFVEATTDQIDNLVLPFVMYIIMLF